MLDNVDGYLYDVRYVKVKEYKSLTNAVRIFVRDFEALIDYD